MPKTVSKLSFADVKSRLAAKGMTIRHTLGEYRVNFKGGSAGSAYFTSDLQDALLTGLDMAARAEIAYAK